MKFYTELFQSMMKIAFLFLGEEEWKLARVIAVPQKAIRKGKKTQSQQNNKYKTY